MPIAYPRYAAPPEGQTLLLDLHGPWRDPRKEDVNPPLLESEKGINLPSWQGIGTAAAVTAIITTLHHLKIIGR